MSNSAELAKSSCLSEWLKPAEAAELIGVSPNTLKRLVKDGIVKAYRVEGVRGIQFKKEDVLALLKEVEPEEIDGKD